MQAELDYPRFAALQKIWALIGCSRDYCGFGCTTTNRKALYQKKVVYPQYPNIIMHILHTVLYSSLSVDKDNLFYHQELLQLVIVSIILVTWMRDPGVVL